jgi:hypothetical protein
VNEKEIRKLAADVACGQAATITLATEVIFPLVERKIARLRNDDDRQLVFERIRATVTNNCESICDPTKVEHPEAWINAIASNEVARHFRDTRRRHGKVILEADLGCHIADLGAEVNCENSTIDNQEELERVLAELDPQSQQLALMIMAGIGPKAIQRILGITEGRYAHRRRTLKKNADRILREHKRNVVSRNQGGENDA